MLQSSDGLNNLYLFKRLPYLIRSCCYLIRDVCFRCAEVTPPLRWSVACVGPAEGFVIRLPSGLSGRSQWVHFSSCVTFRKVFPEALHICPLSVLSALT